MTDRKWDNYCEIADRNFALANGRLPVSRFVGLKELAEREEAAREADYAEMLATGYFVGNDLPTSLGVSRSSLAVAG